MRLSPFFHAIVVAGAGVAATDCGGVSNDPDGRTGSGGSNAATGGAGQTSSGGSLPATGGLAATGGRAATGGVMATGGVTATGGVMATGGTPADSGAPDPAVFAQLDCSVTGGAYRCYPEKNEFGLYGLLLRGATCQVDLSRPRTSADCKPGEWFACQSAWLGATETAVYVNCQCSPMGSGACVTEAYRGESLGCDTAVCDGARLVCGCAQPIILI